MRAARRLRELIAEGRAGLDPYERTTLLIDCQTVLQAAAASVAINEVGLILDSRRTGDGIRLRVLLEADIRDELQLDRENAPVMVDEPLASRGATS